MKEILNQFEGTEIEAGLLGPEGEKVRQDVMKRLKRIEGDLLIALKSNLSMPRDEHDMYQELLNGIGMAISLIKVFPVGTLESSGRD